MIYKNFNQFNYTTLTLVIDDNNKTIKLYKGLVAPLGYDKKASKKAIYNLYQQYKNIYNDLTEA